eukprot:5488526-Pyramimonas_sp.AAC.1
MGCRRSLCGRCPRHRWPPPKGDTTGSVLRIPVVSGRTQLTPSESRAAPLPRSDCLAPKTRFRCWHLAL